MYFCTVWEDNIYLQNVHNNPPRPDIVFIYCMDQGTIYISIYFLVWTVWEDNILTECT